VSGNLQDGKRIVFKFKMDGYEYDAALENHGGTYTGHWYCMRNRSMDKDRFKGPVYQVKLYSDGNDLALIGKWLEDDTESTLNLEAHITKEEPHKEPCAHRHTHIEKITSGAICDDCGEEL
jgi:hypothetical protein